MCQAGHAISSLGSSLMASRAKADAEALLAEIRVIDGSQAAAPVIHYKRSIAKRRSSDPETSALSCVGLC
jgi:hypothetical protein